jgi:SRSO17 transposase
MPPYSRRSGSIPWRRSEERGPIQAWIVDDSGITKKGQHSVGVARQYCGQLGKHDNCQVAVTLAVANDAASLPIAYQLYLPEPCVNNHPKVPPHLSVEIPPSGLKGV